MSCSVLMTQDWFCILDSLKFMNIIGASLSNPHTSESLIQVTRSKIYEEIWTQLYSTLANVHTQKQIETI